MFQYARGATRDDDVSNDSRSKRSADSSWVTAERKPTMVRDRGRPVSLPAARIVAFDG